MEQQIGHGRGWKWSVAIGVAGIAFGAAFGGSVAFAQGRFNREADAFSVQMTRIPNPDTSLARSIDEDQVGQPDMYFYKVKDNQNSRILYYMYYKGSMLAPLYTTGE